MRLRRPMSGVGHLRLPIPNGITGRISVLSWLVTLQTLTIFVLAIIPEQKRDLQRALESKGRGVISSLGGVTAGAAVSEDYTTVVEHCLQVLTGDEEIEYLVLTRRDGFSIIVERSNWRTATLDSYWRPEERKPASGIEVVPVFGRRSFHVARPFDYSGFEWGWIHAGLSLKSYDRSVARIYTRTGLLAVLCVGLSLLASVIYARRLVRPITSLEAVVRQVSHGDLAARADIHSRDEVESLSRSFNTMADSIVQTNGILESVRLAAQQFLSAGDWRALIGTMLARIGTAVHASQASVYEYDRDADGQLVGRLIGTWSETTETGTGSATVGVQDQCPQPLDGAGKLHSGDAMLMPPEDLSGGKPDTILRSPSILIQIQAGEDAFGFLRLEDCTRNREWSVAECHSFRALAGMLGTSISRQRAQDALLVAKETLEVRVAERTGELRKQVNAKERARAELAEAQQHLMDLSRLSGMAEIATGVLHNVGNVLNSVNVSANLVSEKIRESRVDNLVAVIRLMRQHSEGLAEFLASDPKGQRLIPYLEKLGGHFEEEQRMLRKELTHLTDHVGHIKRIVATQQNYAKVSGMVEVVSLADVAEDAYRILETGFDLHKIRLERDFEQLPPVALDKHKIIQILLNLLRNAKESIKESATAERVVRVRIRRFGDDRVRLEVSDSGIGLSAQNLTRIFAHGFTTKADGHGFGLHSGALAARQMGGSLSAHSDGPGRGATFVLEIPLAVAAQVTEKVA